MSHMLLFAYTLFSYSILLSDNKLYNWHHKAVWNNEETTFDPEGQSFIDRNLEEVDTGCFNKWQKHYHKVNKQLAYESIYLIW